MKLSNLLWSCFCVFVTVRCDPRIGDDGNDNNNIPKQDLYSYAGLAFLKKCDKDSSGTVSRKELKKCFDQLMPPSADFGYKQFFKAVDINQDGVLTTSEYVSVLELSDKMQTDVIEVTRKDGTKRLMSKDEVMKLMEESSATKSAMSSVKEETGKATLTELGKNNPKMSAFVELGNWSLNSMKSVLNCSHAKLKQLRSLPAGGSPNRGKEDGKDDFARNVYEAWLEMSLVCNQSSEIRFVEVHLERDPAKYRSPYLCVLESWLLDEKGVRTDSLPVAQCRASISIKKILSGLILRPLMLFLLCCVVVGAIRWVFLVNEYQPTIQPERKAKTM